MDESLRINLRSGESKAIVDKGILERFANNVITAEKARMQVEKNNQCEFDSDRHFVVWASCLGYWR